MALKRSNLNLDSPVNNFATLNPLVDSSATLTNGNLQFLGINPGYTTILSTLCLHSGKKWYWEILATSGDSCTGIATESANLAGLASPASGYLGFDAHGYVYFGHSGQKYHNNSGSSYGPTFGNGDVIGVLYDGINNTLSYYKNGSSLGIAFSSLSTTEKYFIAVSEAAGGNAITTYLNCGQNPDFCGEKTGGGRHSDANGRGQFYYKPPWGALALCSANLTAAMNEAPSQNFKAVTWAGDNSGITIDSSSHNLQLTPDLMFIKWRSGVNSSNPTMVYDSVRGFDYFLQTSNTNPESDAVSGIESVESNSVELKHLDVVNQTGADYVGWFWKAGGAPADNKMMKDGEEFDVPTTTGARTPTAMSVNTKAGFSIIQYEGTGSAITVPHGLSQAPEFIIVKNITSTTDGGSGSGYSWTVYHKDLTYTHYGSLDGSGQFENDYTVWGAAPNSSVFSFGANPRGSNPNEDYIAYCWHSVPGYSAFGSYLGTNHQEKGFHYLGFKPGFIMIKDTTSNGSWAIFDNARGKHNPIDNTLFADSSVIEDTSTDAADQNQIDFLSNGFFIRCDNANSNMGNATGNRYIYMAFAEKPPTVPEKVKYEVSSEPRHSLYFNGSSYLNRTLSAGSTTKFTYSCWLKRSTMNSGGSDILWFASNDLSGYAVICFTNNQLRFYDVTNNNTGDENADVKSSHVFRDQSSFAHVVLSVNASEAILDNKVKIYVNGVHNSLDSSSFFNDTVLSTMNTNISTNIGNQSNAIYMNGYLSNVYFIDGVACSADYFGKYENGKWVAKEYEGGYGTNGFRLDFAPDNMEYNSSGNLTIVKDSSGNGNHWTAST